MAVRPRFTAQLPVTMEPELREQIEEIAQTSTDPEARSLAGTVRMLVRLGLDVYRARQA